MLRVADKIDLDALLALSRRLFALIQVGESARAEAELRLLWAENAGNPGLQRALLLVAREARPGGLDQLPLAPLSAPELHVARVVRVILAEIVAGHRDA